MAERIADSGVPSLVVHQADQPDRTIPLHGDGYRLGREDCLEVPLNHPTISRVHALLERHGRHWLLIDQDSTNGIW